MSKEDYRKVIDDVAQFLSGETAPIQRELQRRMREAAEGNQTVYGQARRLIRDMHDILQPAPDEAKSPEPW